MTWTLDDFRRQPERLTKQLQCTLYGFPTNNAPYSEQITVGRDQYSLMDLGRDAVGTIAVEQAFGPPNQISLTGNKGDGGNAYLLPWASNKLFLAELGGKHDLFFTAMMNSCAVIISGGRCNPSVIHANTKSNALNAAPLDQLGAVYGGIYRGMANALAQRGIVDLSNMAIFEPAEYQGKGTVFGVRLDSRWTFYCTTWVGKGSVTRQLWPVPVPH